MQLFSPICLLINLMLVLWLQAVSAQRENNMIVRRDFENLMQQYAKTDDRTDDILRRIEGIRFKKYVSPLIRNQSVDDSRLSGYLVGHSCQAERVSQHIFCKNLVFIHAKQLFSKN